MKTWPPSRPPPDPKGGPPGRPPLRPPGYPLAKRSSEVVRPNSWMCSYLYICCLREDLGLFVHPLAGLKVPQSHMAAKGFRRILIATLIQPRVLSFLPSTLFFVFFFNDALIESFSQERTHRRCPLRGLWVGSSRSGGRQRPLRSVLPRAAPIGIFRIFSSAGTRADQEFQVFLAHCWVFQIIYRSFGSADVAYLKIRRTASNDIAFPYFLLGLFKIRPKKGAFCFWAPSGVSLLCVSRRAPFLFVARNIQGS